MTAPDSIPPDLSVVVALISGKKDDLARCLAALEAQVSPPSMEVLVPYDAECSAVTELRAQYPRTRFLLAEGLDTKAARAGASREHHDTLRTIGLREARGRVVALTEDHACATPTWCADMVRLVDEHPKLAAIGGAVECKGERLLNHAVYYCDFGRYQNPLPEGPAEYVSDSNVAYRREALEAIRDALADDYHETVVHGALVARGFEIWLTPRSMVHQVRTGLSWSGAIRERFVWGRSFAGTRVRGAPLSRRLVFAAICGPLPFLLTWRLLRGVLQRKRDVGRFFACLPAVFFLSVVWSVGELVGYLTGNPGTP